MMKKNVFLLFFIGALILSGCNEKDLVNQISGTWKLQQYDVAGKNVTYAFDTTHLSYTWTFSSSKTFTQSWKGVRYSTIYTPDTIGYMDTITHTYVIDSIISVPSVVGTPYSVTIGGQWLLTNGNQFIETNDSTNNTTLYQIIHHSKGNLQLLTGNTEYYLAQ